MIDTQLPSALRTNLLVLRNSGKQQQDIQQRLSTGLKVNSALNGPQAFFAAKGLESRANDLQSLKDAMAQGVSTIQAADKGISSVSDLLKQARGLTTSALSNLENTPAGLAARKSLAQQFDRIRDQIDKVVQDSSYAGKNLLVGDGMKLAATSESRKLVTDITGIRHADLTNVTKEDDYKIEVLGSGQITGLDADIQNAEQLFGFKELTVGGQNSKTQGSFDDIRFELHGRPGRDATLVVLDGDESWTVKLKAEELSDLSESKRSKKISHLFNSGAEIDIEIDPQALQAALQPSGMVKASVQRDVDLEVKVTNTAGVSVSRSANTQDNSTRLFAGENAFRFDGGTVRLDLDAKIIQDAAPVTGGLIGDLGPFADMLADTEIQYVGDEDVHVILNAFSSGPGNSGYAIRGQFQIGGTNNTYVIGDQYGISTAGYNEGYHYLLTPGGKDYGYINSVGTNFINRTISQSTGLTTADSAGSSMQYANPYWVGWKTDSQLQISYGPLVDGRRVVTVDDGQGGQFSGYPTIALNENNWIFNVIKIEGGPNDGATMGLFDQFATWGFPDEQAGGNLAIDVFANKAIQVLPAGEPNAPDFDDLTQWGGFKQDSYVGISLTPYDSEGAGYRKLTAYSQGVDGTAYVDQEFIIANGAHDNLAFVIPSGPNQGAKFRFDVPDDSSFLGTYAIVMHTSPPSGVADFVIRRPQEGETATLRGIQATNANTENDLHIQFNEANSSSLVLNSASVSVDGQGLRLDGSANEWRDRSDVEQAIADLDTAESRLQATSRGLQVNMDVIITRLDFSAMIASTLSEGAAKLTEADQNEEAANSLMLDTRRQLATMSLSLTVSGLQSILRLF